MEVSLLITGDNRNYLTVTPKYLSTYSIENLDVQRIEDTVSLAPYLFIRGDESQLPDDLTEIITFTKQLLDMNTEEAVAVETCALRHECVTLHLNCLYEDNDITKTIIEGSAKTDLQELTKLEATAYMNKLLFRAIYLRTLLLHEAASEDDADDNDAKTWCDTLLNNEYLESEFCKILYDYTIVLSLHEAYTFVSSVYLCTFKMFSCLNIYLNELFYSGQITIS